MVRKLSPRVLHNWLLYFLVSLLLQSCYTITGNQTAQTLPPKVVEGGGNISLIHYPKEIRVRTFDSVGSRDLRYFAALDGYGRLGLANRIDVGIKFDYFGNLQPDVKLCLYQATDSSFALASGFLATTNFVFWYNPEFTLSITSLGVPIYASLHPTRNFDFYTSARYFIFPFFRDRAGSSYLVYNCGFRAGGEAAKFTMDISYLKPYGTFTADDLLPLMLYFSVGAVYRL